MAVQATTFEALGRTFTFKFGFGAICRLEQQFDRPFGAVVADMLPGVDMDVLEDPARLAEAAGRMRFDYLGALIAAGTGETSETVADIMDELGIERAIALIFGAVENDVSGGPRPKKARAPAGASRGR